VRGVKSWKELLFLVGVCVLAFSIRFAFVYAARAAELTYDELQYDDIATHLVEGHGFAWYTDVPFGPEPRENRIPGGIKTTFRPPGYPWFIAGIYYVFGTGNWFAVRVAQAVLGALVPLLVYAVCQTFSTRNAARLGAVIAALYPPFVVYTLAFLIENLFPLLTGIAFLCLIKLGEKEKTSWAVLSGFFYGLAVLTRPSLTYFIPVLFLWLYFPKREFAPAFKRFAVFAGIITVMVFPWVFRNYYIAGQFVYLDTRTGYNMHIGFNEYADGSFNFESADVFMDMDRLDILFDDTARHNFGMEQALNYIRENPGRSLALIPLKFSHFWDLDKREFITAYSWNYIGPLPPPLLFGLFFVLLSPFAIVVLFAVVGTVFSDISRPISLFVLFSLYYMTLASLILGDSRLHMALIPFLIALAAHGMVLTAGAIRRLMRRNGQPFPWTPWRCATAGAIALVFFSVWTFGLYRDWEKFETIFAPGGNTTYLPY
jgi:4-amino-4-deoxy-L-arabinose transferase-like glycosyltransferase